MRLMSGMSFTDLIAVINAAKDSNVKLIELEGLRLEFDTNFHPNKNHGYAAHMDVNGVGEEGQPPGPNHFPITDEPRVTDDQLIMSEMSDLLAIEDPAEFERLQLEAISRGTNN